MRCTHAFFAHLGCRQCGCVRRTPAGSAAKREGIRGPRVFMFRTRPRISTSMINGAVTRSRGLWDELRVTVRDGSHTLAIRLVIIVAFSIWAIGVASLVGAV